MTDRSEPGRRVLSVAPPRRTTPADHGATTRLLTTRLHEQLRLGVRMLRAYEIQIGRAERIVGRIGEVEAACNRLESLLERLDAAVTPSPPTLRFRNP